MSEEKNNAPEPEQVEGMLDLVENKAGVLLDPNRGGKTTPTTLMYPRNLFVGLS